MSATYLFGGNTQKCRATSSEQSLIYHYPLSWEKGVTKRRYLILLVCAKNLSSECFFVILHSRLEPSSPNSSDVLDTETKRKLGIRGKEEKKQRLVIRSGKLMKNGKIKALEKISVHYLPIKEREIMELFFKDSGKSECPSFGGYGNQPHYCFHIQKVALYMRKPSWEDSENRHWESEDKMRLGSYKELEKL
ncbi:hypothetical protein NPIL_446011 [Nephila pilipes]|uniref:Uncharacterized protein n=1 Tax=Nephila pilipes TaxID=299642 RepID=A0A8X6QY48_NEPPI|nr:hypothetical protein NPIL_446011 [Nephila pilipes]